MRVMDPKKIALLVGALIIAGVTAFMAKNMFAGSPAPQAQAAVAPQPVGPKILVATRALPIGTIIGPDSFRYQPWPKELVKNAYFVEGQNVDLNKLNGTVVRNAISAGQPITQGALVKSGDRGFLAAALGPGMRAVTVSVSAQSGVAGFVFPGAVGAEFQFVSDKMRIGRTMDEALQDAADRLNVPEFQFFCISLAIQRETGGNLAETLSNLADVLRKRSQMKLKIRAMSSESKVSAYIVGSLPFIVFGLLYTMNPGYIGDFFTDERLMIIGLGGLIWMGIGVGIMAKMVSFEI